MHINHNDVLTLDEHLAEIIELENELDEEMEEEEVGELKEKLYKIGGE